MDEVLKIKMFGVFSVSYGDVLIGEDKLSKKVCLLLAYLIYHRNRVVPQEELIRTLWNGEEEGRNDVLKATVWRARQTLESFGKDVSKQLILRERDGYRWNPSVSMETDWEAFEDACRRSDICEDKDSRLELYREALSLYQGPFFGKLSAEPWAIPIAAYFHNAYIGVLLESLPLFLEKQCFQEMELLCQRAIALDPYQETLHRFLMRSLIGQQLFEKAAEVYVSLRELLFTDLGISPESATQELYHEISRNIGGYALSLDAIQEQLREGESSPGAMLCEYALFRHFYQAEARAMLRRGDAIHIGIISVTDIHGKELPKRSLDRAMENLGVQIRLSLRRSDLVARCSPSQFIVMLLQANYENSLMVCKRTIRAFSQAYPHSPASIRYSVLPLEPSTTPAEYHTQ